jgi:probable addiction module antidote protein
MPTEKIDTTKYINTQEDIDLLLKITLEDFQQTGDKSEFLAGLRLASKGLNKIQTAKELGVSEKHLYKMLSPTGNPTIENLQKIVNKLGYHLTIERNKPYYQHKVSR